MNCKTCGNKISFTFGEDRNKELEDSQHCFDCNFWDTRLIEMQTDPNYYVANGNLFWDGGHGKTDIFGYKAHGGYPFYIKCHDGRKVTTDNLWHNGEIPPEWIEKFPNTAVFVGSFDQ